MNLFVFNNKTKINFEIKAFFIKSTFHFKYLVSKITLLLVVVVFYSCDTKRMNKQISNIASETKQDDYFNFDWRLKHFFENDEFEYFIADYQKPDTSITLKFKHFKANGKCKIDEYYKRYLDIDDDCNYILKWCYDTLYFYNYDFDNEDWNRKFIVGKYYYLYENNQLNPYQRKYFELYRDSLIKVRGDDLPRLPELK